MPYALEPNGDGTYRVVNRDSGKVHARRTSKRRGEAQIRLLQAREHGFTPTQRRR